MRIVGLICTGALGWLAVRSDVRTLTVPDRYQAGLLMLLALAARPVPGEPVWQRALAAAAFAALLMPAGRAGALGGADIKLSFTLAYTLGLKTAVLIFMLASIFFLWIHGACPRLPGRRRSRPGPGARRGRTGRSDPRRDPCPRASAGKALSAPQAFFPFIAAAAAPAVIRLWTTGLPLIF